MVGCEAGNRGDRANPDTARARKISLLLRRASLLHADFRAERSLATLDVGRPFARDADAVVRARLRNVRRQYRVGGRCDLGIQPTRGGIRAYGANVPDDPDTRARATPDVVANTPPSEC